jgi:hypothetical protein
MLHYVEAILFENQFQCKNIRPGCDLQPVHPGSMSVGRVARTPPALSASGVRRSGSAIGLSAIS